MNIRITSWNTFGACIGKISQVSGSLISNDRKDILLIQEAGSTDSECAQLIGKKNLTIGRKKFKCLFKDDLRSTNKRCTTGIFVEEDLYSESAVKLDSLQIDGIRRPVVFCTLQPDGYSPLYIATIHATACSRISIKEIDKINKKFKKFSKELGWQWILMGDFNVEPNTLMQEGVPANNIINPDQYTHININDPSKNAILDYAVVSNGLTNLSVNCCEYSGTSDHIPVYLELTVNK